MQHVEGTLDLILGTFQKEMHAGGVIETLCQDTCRLAGSYLLNI